MTPEEENQSIHSFASLLRSFYAPGAEMEKAGRLWADVYGSTALPLDAMVHPNGRVDTDGLARTVSALITNQMMGPLLIAMALADEVAKLRGVPAGEVIADIERGLVPEE
jgi:hypothetical protein